MENGLHWRLPHGCRSRSCRHLTVARASRRATRVRSAMALRIVEGPYWRDILDQPRALERHAPRLESTRRARRRRAPPARRRAAPRRAHRDGLVAPRPRPAAPAARRRGPRPAHGGVFGASPLPAARCSPTGTLLVLVSQSGRSAEILRLLEAVRGQGVVTLGLTNTAESPLAREATAVVLTHAGEEATVSCKTYLATQMALAWLGEVLAGGDREAARAALGETIPRRAGVPRRRGARTSSGSRSGSTACARSTTPGAAPRSPPPARPASSRRSRRTARRRA